MSNYKQIAGVKYEKELLDLADVAAKDGQISHSEAKGLWQSALDGAGVTEVERRTLEYVLKEYKCTDKARALLRKMLDLPAAEAKAPQSSYYRVIGGVRYDRELLEQAAAAAKDGPVSADAAKALWAAARDGKGVTEVERRTLEHVLKEHAFAPAAAELLRAVLKDGAGEAAAAEEDELPDFDEDAPAAGGDEPKEDGPDAQRKGGYAAIHASGFRDFLLKPELLRAIVDCGFEHPSEVQHECIPQAILGTDILCQAKSGMGKTAVFVLACLQQLDVSEPVPKVLVLCHTRELAYQIKHEFDRFAKYLADAKCGVVYGGVPIAKDKEMLRSSPPHVLIGTPGRVMALIREKDLKLGGVTQFVLDECDKCVDRLDMRQDIQRIFLETPKKKQVMMFSATLTAETRGVCKKFMADPHEISVDESKLTLHGLLQYYVKLTEKEKNRKLNDLLDALEFNQVVIFVKSVQRCIALDKLLVECNFPSVAIHSGLSQDERIEKYKQFKDFQKRIMVATDLFGRGIDIERVNIVINYDMPEDSDSYLHRVGRAGRFGTKGLALTFAATGDDEKTLKAVQDRFEVNIEAMPGHIDTTSYLNA